MARTAGAWRAVIAVFCVALVVSAASGPLAVAAAPESAGERAKRPTVLLLHAGGFVFGSPELMDRAVRMTRRRGFQPRAVSYELGSLPGAYRDARRAARRARRQGHVVYAYGESAGGTLAALLANRGAVRAAVAYAPISNLLQWRDPETGEPMASQFGATRRQMRMHSPALQRARRPIEALTPAYDPALNPPTRRWARRDPLVRNVTVPGGHGFIGAPEYPENLRRAVRLLRCHAFTAPAPRSRPRACPGS